MKLFLRLFSPLLLLAIAAAGADSPLDEKVRAGMLAEFSATDEVLTARIAREPSAIPLYSSRGDARLMLGRSKDAVADFEKMIALDPAQDAPHWRLGIAYYLAGDYTKSARQFAKYHDYDSSDRENGIWKFLADARAEGIEPARRAMLVYKHFDREPFPDLYDMFAGKKTGAEVFAAIDKKGLSHDRDVMFFANYYVGLNERLLGDDKSAREHLRQAIEGGWSSDSGSPPSYMWQVARLQYESLAPQHQER